jgi:hypothetical protein
MANEVRGKLYETIAQKALEEAIKIAGIHGVLRWNETPEGLSVEPDFTIGEDKDHPCVIVMVTASGSSSDSHKKSWRNLGEFQEIKAQLPEMPRVVNLYFISEVKKAIAVGTNKLYDATIHVQTKPYHEELDRWVNANLKDIAKTKEEKIELLEKALESNPVLAKSISALAKDLAHAIQQENADLKPLWGLMREDFKKTHKVPTARKTSVRRGLAKLLVVEKKTRGKVYDFIETGKPIEIGKDEKYLNDLRYLKQIIGGYVVYDQEIRSVFEILGKKKCEEILSFVGKRIDAWICELRQLDNLNKFIDFIAQNKQKIAVPPTCLMLLEQCQENPGQFAMEMGISFNGTLDRNWLFSTIVTILKADTGRLTGYGYAQLSADIGDSKEISSGYLTLADWINRKPGVHLKKEVLENISKALSYRISLVKDIPSLKEKVKTTTIKSLLEDRLITYWKYEPLLWLLEAELKKQGKPYTPKKSYVGWINEYAELGKKVVTTPFVKVGNCLIHWKSVSDAGKVHKKKELAARARNMLYQYDPVSKKFSRRNEINRLVLIVDGTFNDEDLKILAQAGWDTIIYPDEIPTFVSSL